MIRLIRKDVNGSVLDPFTDALIIAWGVRLAGYRLEGD